MGKEGESILLPLEDKNYGATGGYNPNPSMHMQTYTAGEDSSRLADMAKEFGLARQRQARQNVRERVPVPLSKLNAFVYQRILDPGFQDVRMRSIYTSHGDLDSDDEEGRLLIGRRPSWREDGEESQDPHAHDLGGDLVSAVLGIIKGMVGPAILYLPHGFANAGYVCAIPILIFSTVLFLCSSACLLDSWKLESQKAIAQSLEAGRKRSKRTILSYPELAYRALGPTGETIVKVGIAAMQSGVCLTYLIFVPQNLQASTLHLFGIDIPASYFMIVMLVCQIPMSWVRDIRKLTVTNLVANILILYGLITCLGFALANAVESEEGLGPFAEIAYKFTHLEPFNSGWFLFMGTSVSIRIHTRCI
jgi:proton-coupled amino acid transporter